MFYMHCYILCCNFKTFTSLLLRVSDCLMFANDVAATDGGPSVSEAKSIVQ